jgi:SAM-dependent methyltransferase
MTEHKNNWDNRYDAERYFYGTEPNYFVARMLDTLTPGRALFLAEGEGRNAVYAAGLGHDVVAVDDSFVGQRKALALAEERGVTLEYRLADVVGGAWVDESWDCIVLCFAHLSPAEMPEIWTACATALRPGGKVILNSFAKSQLGRKSGGPPRLDWLHDVVELRTQFPGLTVVAVEAEMELAEGVGHRGLAMVIELVAHKSVD